MSPDLSFIERVIMANELDIQDLTKRISKVLTGFVFPVNLVAFVAVAGISIYGESGINSILASKLVKCLLLLFCVTFLNGFILFVLQSLCYLFWKEHFNIFIPSRYRTRARRPNFLFRDVSVLGAVRPADIFGFLFYYLIFMVLFFAFAVGMIMIVFPNHI